MVHALIAAARPGEVLVLTLPEPEPVALVGELLATQAAVRGVAGLLVDGAIRDLEELEELGLPIWARFVRARGAKKEAVGELDVAVRVGGAEIRPGDILTLDCDGAVVIPVERAQEIESLARAREAREKEMRARLQEGALSYDLHDLRRLVEGS
jgi:4-hydroxy-4-methyl-2-oxoglutarate aldolase